MTTWVRRRAGLALLTGALALAACATPPEQAASAAATPPAAPKPIRPGLDPAARPDPFPSTYRAQPSGPVLFVNATILTAAGPRIDGGSLLIRDGKIIAVGKDIARPADARVIDAAGRWLTPGIIDPHAHIGAGSSPTAANGDGSNENGPNPGGVWIEHSVWTQDPMFERARQAGVTTMQILPGSSNLFNGRTVTLKNVPAIAPQGMKFPGAPYGLKMACGENPTGGGGGKPGTRAGGMMGYRNTFIAAQAYAQNWADWRKKGTGDPPRRDLMLETVAGALNGDIKVHIHCYRADEMATMLDLADEFGFRIAAFHHGVEAYKLADRLAQEGVCGALWADWWGFKMEAFDGIQENIALVDRPANSCAIVHSDSPEGIQRLNQEAAKVIAAARRADMPAIAPERAITWMTANAAKALGIEGKTGTLEAGKNADVVVWNGNPFSSYALADQVFIDGHQYYDRADPRSKPVSDFRLGQEVR